MKKILLIFGIAILLLSCTKEDTCDCQKETWITLSYNDNLSEDFTYTNGQKEYYSDNCDDNDKVVDGYYQPGQDYNVEVNYIVKCE